MTQSAAVRLVTELALANHGYISLPGGGVDGNALIKSGSGVAWGSGAGGTAVNSVNGRTGVVALTKADVGLSSAENTTDLAKPLSTATQVALSAKVGYPGGGSDGQVLTKSGTSAVWSGTAGDSTAGVTLITTADSVSTINTKLATPGVVRFLPGTYNVGTNALFVYGSTRTVVQGDGAIINSTYNDAILRVDHADHVIEGLIFQGQGVATNNQSGILVFAAGVTIRGCRFLNLARCGVTVASGADGTSVVGNLLDNCSLGTLTDLGSLASLYVAADRVFSLHNRITSAYWGIAYRGTDASTPIVGGLIDGNVLQCRSGAGVGAVGISVAYARHHRTVHNHVDGFKNNSIDNYGSWYLVVAENSCSNSGGDGVFVGSQGTHSVAVSNNSIFNCSNGVRLWDGASYITVTSNVIDGCTFSGIQARGAINSGEAALNNNTISNNQINGQNGTTPEAAIWVKNCLVALLLGNETNRTKKQGILLESVDLARVQNNILQDPSYNGPSRTFNGIDLDAGCDRSVIDDNLVFGVANVCIAVGGGTDHRVRGNRLRGSFIDTVTDAGANTVLYDNVAV